MDRWDVPELFDLVRGAYPFRDLPPEVFERVLCLVSGRFPTGSLRDLRARIAWDRIHNRLAALPGSARLALVGGGTIPDTGQYPVFLGEEGPRLGELDEEFVFERRVGETFALGNNTWRIEAIEAHKVVVSPAEGNTAVMPFWRGEATPRSPELGEAVGALCREIVGRLDDPGLPGWLERECRLEPRAARHLIRYVARQQRVAGVVPDDRTILVETFRDPAGELGLAVLSPFGGKIHQGLKIALLGRIRQRFGVQASCLHGDDGLLIRLPQMDEPPARPARRTDRRRGRAADPAGAARDRTLRPAVPPERGPGAADAPARSLQANAALAPAAPGQGPAPGRGQVPRFPDRRRDLSRVPRSRPRAAPAPRRSSTRSAAGAIRVVTRQGEIASPFASELIFQFTPTLSLRVGRAAPGRPAARADRPSTRTCSTPLLAGTRPRADCSIPQAVGRVEGRLRRRGLAPRTAEEMAETLASLGDLSPSELFGPMETLLEELREDRAGPSEITLPGTHGAGALDLGRGARPVPAGLRARRRARRRRPSTRSSGATSARTP